MAAIQIQSQQVSFNPYLSSSSASSASSSSHHSPPHLSTTGHPVHNHHHSHHPHLQPPPPQHHFAFAPNSHSLPTFLSATGSGHLVHHCNYPLSSSSVWINSEHSTGVERLSSAFVVGGAGVSAGNRSSDNSVGGGDGSSMSSRGIVNQRIPSSFNHPSHRHQQHSNLFNQSHLFNSQSSRSNQSFLIVSTPPFIVW